MRPKNADSAKTRILKALFRAPHSAVELANPAIGGLRYSARIKELRDEGHPIIGEEIPGKSYLMYRVALTYRLEQQQLF
jgi:hypothetical protein